MPAQDFEESEYRAHLHKDWTRYKTEQFTFEMKAISQAVESQRTALNELRSESEELYQLAIQVKIYINQ